VSLGRSRADTTAVPRITQQPVTLVEQLASLQRQILQCRRDALGYARQAGDVLRSVPPEERAALARQAGITGRRSRFIYVQVAENWEAVQSAASINQALALLRQQRLQGTRWQAFLDFEGTCLVVGHAARGWCWSDRGTL
jgi:hypothetical protein